MPEPDKNADDTQAVDDASSTLEATIATMQTQMLADDLKSQDTPPEPKETPPADETPPNDTTPPQDDPPIVEPSEDDGDEKDEPILPVGHRRAALARGWSPEEIDHYLSTKPEEATVTFRDTFNEWQKESAEWSARGRALMAASKDASENDEDEDVPVAKLDVDALVAQHGNEELINAIVGPVNTVIDKLNVATEQVTKTQKDTEASRVEGLATEAQSFLMSEGMKSYRDVYGTEIKDLTDAQVEKRFELFEQADIIMAGARDHGKNPTIGSVMSRAHAIVSRGSRAAEIRNEVRASMTKRTKTSRSARTKTPSVDTGNEPVSEAELEKRVEVGLAKLRGK